MPTLKKSVYYQVQELIATNDESVNPHNTLDHKLAIELDGELRPFIATLYDLGKLSDLKVEVFDCTKQNWKFWSEFYNFTKTQACGLVDEIMLSKYTRHNWWPELPISSSTNAPPIRFQYLNWKILVVNG